MKWSNQELKRIYFGAYRFEETEDGYLQAFQYSAAQMEYFRQASEFWYDRCMASTAKTLEINTTAQKLAFDYKFLWKGSEDSFELAVDGLIRRIDYVRDLKEEGRLSYDLPQGRKRVTVYLPADATVVIRDFETDASGAAPIKNCRVLWLGDSITQGFGPLRSAHTYVSVANRLLDYDLINQGIGGYVYDKGSLMKMDGYTPDKIIVALGTNQFGTEDMTPIEEYYARLMEIYGQEIPVLCITPLWRGDVPGGFPKLASFCEEVKAICRKYPNVRIVDGFTLVPHLPEYFLDRLHPNALGAEMYGLRLVQAIREMGF